MLRTSSRFFSPLPAFVPAIWVAGLNWTSHAEEVKLPKPQKPIFCMKSPSSLLYPPSQQFTEANDVRTFCGTFGQVITVPKELQAPPEVDYEGELAVVIGSKCADLSPEEVVKHQDSVIAGFCCSLDMTARRWQGQKGGGQWCIAKSFNTFLPLGPELVKLSLEELPSLSLTTKLNGKIVQHDKFSNFIFDVPTLISFLSNTCVLHPGMVILTGTPAGVGFARKSKARSIGTSGDGKEQLIPDPYYLIHGDELEVSIEKIGSIACRVEYEGKFGPRLPV